MHLRQKLNQVFDQNEIILEQLSFVERGICWSIANKQRQRSTRETIQNPQCITTY
jgi:hypothetical protein